MRLFGAPLLIDVLVSTFGHGFWILKSGHAPVQNHSADVSASWVGGEGELTGIETESSQDKEIMMDESAHGQDRH